MAGGVPFLKHSGDVAMEFIADVIAQNAFAVFGGINKVNENPGQGLRHIQHALSGLGGFLVMDSQGVALGWIIRPRRGRDTAAPKGRP